MYRLHSNLTFTGHNPLPTEVHNMYLLILKAHPVPSKVLISPRSLSLEIIISNFQWTVCNFQKKAHKARRFILLHRQTLKL